LVGLNRNPQFFRTPAKPDHGSPHCISLIDAQELTLEKERIEEWTATAEGTLCVDPFLAELGDESFGKRRLYFTT
jgi:hypothetical protein